MARPLVEVREAWYRYGRSRPYALRGASMRLEPGMVIAITGPNGSGKTTLLKVAGFLLEPERGEVLVEGAPACRATCPPRGFAVYVHSEPYIFRGSVLRNIEIGPLLRGAEPGLARKRALETAKLLGLDRILDRPARSLSRGLKALLGVARAIAAGPRVLLLDEPFANLDRERRTMLATLLRRLASEGLGVAVSGHDLSLLAGVSDWMLYLEEGRVVLEGPPSSVLRGIRPGPCAGRG